MIDTEQKYIQKLSIQSLYWCWIDVLCRTRINVLWCFVDVFSTFTIDVQMKFLHYNFRRPQLQATEDVWREPGVVQIKGPRSKSYREDLNQYSFVSVTLSV